MYAGDRDREGIVNNDRLALEGDKVLDRAAMGYVIDVHPRNVGARGDKAGNSSLAVTS